MANVQVRATMELRGKVACPLCREYKSWRNLRLHALFKHEYDQRRPIYELLVDKYLASFYRLPSDQLEYRVPKPGPEELLTALRSGTPPRFGLLTITAGREGEVESIRDMLDDSRRKARCCLILVGENGSGKTHLLNCARELALERRYLVFKVDLIGMQTRLSDGGDFSSCVLRNGFLPDLWPRNWTPAAFHRVLVQKLEETARRTLSSRGEDVYSNVELVNAMIYLLREVGGTVPTELAETVGSLLPAKAVRHLGTFDVDGPDALGNWLGDFAIALGYSGVILLVDELEAGRTLEDYQLLEEIVLRSHSSAKWILAGTPDLLWNPVDGIRVIAPDLLDAFEGSTVALRRFRKKDYLDLGERGSTIYSAVHPEVAVDSRELGKLAVAAIRSDLGPRAFIRVLIEYLDKNRKAQKQ